MMGKSGRPRTPLPQHEPHLLLQAPRFVPMGQQVTP